MMFSKFRENKRAGSGSLQDRLASYYRKCEDGLQEDAAPPLSVSQHSKERRKEHADRNRRARIARQYERHPRLPVDDETTGRALEERGLRKFDLTDDYNLRHAAIDVLLDRGIPCRSLPTNRHDHRWRYIASSCGFNVRQIQLLQELVRHQRGATEMPDEEGIEFEAYEDSLYGFSSGGFGYSSDLGGGYGGGSWRTISEDPQHSREQAVMYGFTTPPGEKSCSFDREDSVEHRHLPCAVAQWALPQSGSGSVSVSEPASPTATTAPERKRVENAAAPSILNLRNWAMRNVASW